MAYRQDTKGNIGWHSLFNSWTLSIFRPCPQAEEYSIKGPEPVATQEKIQPSEKVPNSAETIPGSNIQATNGEQQQDQQQQQPEISTDNTQQQQNTEDQKQSKTTGQNGHMQQQAMRGQQKQEQWVQCI